MIRRSLIVPMVLAAVCAVLAALVPSQASAALPKKAFTTNAYSYASCTFTREKTDLVAGTVTLKIQANARPSGFNAFKNTYTAMSCAVYDSFFSTQYYDVFETKLTLNQVRRVTLPIASVGIYCAEVYTEQKSGANDYNQGCTAA